MVKNERPLSVPAMTIQMALAISLAAERNQFDSLRRRSLKQGRWANWPQEASASVGCRSVAFEEGATGPR
jgi:hypothetical protein